MLRLTALASRGAAKVLGIKVEEPEDIYEDFLVESSEAFYEKQPTAGEVLRQHWPTLKGTRYYVQSLFPCALWIDRYNLQWLIGDLVAGVTVAAVAVPQGLAYARLATLDVQFGLYSCFMGHLIYWLFGTSKDISIGPIAVMAILTGRAVEDVGAAFPDVPPHVIASSLSILAGVLIVLLGLVRCGWLIDLVPLVSLSAFVTGSALTIGASQLPSLLGVPHVNTSRPLFHVLIATLKALPTAHGQDAAIGLTSLALLYFIRHASGRLAARWPARARPVFFAATLRTVLVLLLCTMISWLVNRSHPQTPSFKILTTVPSGFRDVGMPPITAGIAKKLLAYLPASVIVLLLEHIAIAKAFGRMHNYTVNPSQEMVAIGTSNILGAFLGAFPSTGAFSRTAVQSKAGARTPASGLVTAIVVLLAIYVLPPLFRYIPSATLAAVVIHAVGDLVTAPNTVYRFWCISPLEVFVFLLGVLATVFTTVDIGIYATVGLSVAILLVRALRTGGDFLGPVRVHTVVWENHIRQGLNQKNQHPPGSATKETSIATTTPPALPAKSQRDDARNSVGDAFPLARGQAAYRNIFLPVGHVDGTNPAIDIGHSYPGIFIYRFNEGFVFPGAAHTLSRMAEHILAHTQSGADQQSAASTRKRGERQWSAVAAPRYDPKDSWPSTADTIHLASGNAAASSCDRRPTLKAVILDFSSVNHVDVTSMQQLNDMRKQLDRHAAPDVVDWHMACIRNPWTKRALVAAGFGHPPPRQQPANNASDGEPVPHWRMVFSVAELGSGREHYSVGIREENKDDITERNTEVGAPATKSDSTIEPSTSHTEVRRVAVHGLNRPLFHVDLTSALQSAVANSHNAGLHLKVPSHQTV